MQSVLVLAKVCFLWDGATSQRDNETRSSASRFDNYVPQKPFVSLDTFIDGNSPRTCTAPAPAKTSIAVQHHHVSLVGMKSYSGMPAMCSTPFSNGLATVVLHFILHVPLLACFKID